MNTQFDKDANKRIIEAITIAALATLASEAVRYGWKQLEARFFPRKRPTKKA
jgi:hypothetical protein